MTTPLNAGTVEVEVRADTSGFDKELGAKVKSSLGNAQKQASQGGSNFGRRFAFAMKAAIPATALAQPLAAVLAGATAALAGPLAAATAGVVAFGAIAVPTYAKVIKASKELAEAQKAVDEAADPKARAKALTEQKRLLDALNPAQKQAVKRLDSLKTAFRALQKELEPATLGVFASGIDAIKAGLPALGTLAKAAAPAIKGVLDGITKSLGGKGAERAVFFLATRAPGAIRAIARGAGDLVQGFAGIVRAFSGFSGTVGGGLADMLDRFSRIGSSKGLADFVTYTKANAPRVKDLFVAIGSAIKTINDAILPLGPLVFGVITVLADLAGSLDPKTLNALIEVYIGLKVALLLYAGAAKAATVVQWALNSALLANPYFAIAAAVVALALAIVYAYKEFETFRRICNIIIQETTGRFVGFVSNVIGAFIKLFDVLGRLPGSAGKNFRKAADEARKLQAQVDAVGVVIDNLNRKKATPTVELLGDRGVLLRLQGIADAMNRLNGLGAKPRVAGPKSLGGGVTIAAAEGGIVRRPTYLLAGEAGPEAIVPLHKSGGGNGPLPGGTAVTQNFYVTERQDPDAQQRQAAFRFRVAAGV